jgi:hypothetical protein
VVVKSLLNRTLGREQWRDRRPLPLERTPRSYFVAHAMDRRTLLIPSMHRSGTSLTAALLASARLHLGERLVPPHVSNLRGNAEDFDFVERYKAALQEVGVHNDGSTFETGIDFPDHLAAQARALVAPTSSMAQPLGDSRTALFQTRGRVVGPLLLPMPVGAGAARRASGGRVVSPQQ